MKIRKKYLFYALAFTSSIIAAGVAALDTAISKLYIPNALIFGFSCFIVGSLISFLLMLFFSISFRSKSIGSRIIDPSFRRIRLIRKEEIKYHILAAIGNTILTISYFSLLNILGNPSAVLPFAQIVILYLIIIESITEKNIPTLVEIQSSIIVTFGAILVSISLSGSITIESLAIVFLIYNPAWILFSIYQRKLKLIKIDNRPNDSLNIRFWNVIFACLITSIVIFFYDILIGTNYFISAIITSINHFGWIALTMALTFFTFVFYIRALGIGKASITQAVRASSVLFAIPFSILLVVMNIIPPFTTEPVLVLVKIIGTTIIILGIISFALSLVKAYIFINIKTGFPLEEIMKKLWNIKGVTRVTATTGKYDFIVKIQIRTLVKGYEKIIRKLDNIEEIQKYRWESVLKEWDQL